MYIKEINKRDKPTFRWQFLLEYFKMSQPATYDKDTQKVNCPAGKRRSFKDLHKLIKYYYPLTSKKGLIRAIARAGTKLDIRGFFCDSEKTVVFFKNSNNELFNPEIFSSVKYNSDKEHRAQKDKNGLSMNKLEEWMKE